MVLATVPTLVAPVSSVAWARNAISGVRLLGRTMAGAVDEPDGRFSSTALFNAATKEINTHCKRELKTNDDCEGLGTARQETSSTTNPTLSHRLLRSPTISKRLSMSVRRTRRNLVGDDGGSDILLFRWVGGGRVRVLNAESTVALPRKLSYI
jgi:hypothetical protein